MRSLRCPPPFSACFLGSNAPLPLKPTPEGKRLSSSACQKEANAKTLGFARANARACVFFTMFTSALSGRARLNSTEGCKKKINVTVHSTLPARRLARADACSSRRLERSARHSYKPFRAAGSLANKYACTMQREKERSGPLLCPQTALATAGVACARAPAWRGTREQLCRARASPGLLLLLLLSAFFFFLLLLLAPPSPSHCFGGKTGGGAEPEQGSRSIKGRLPPLAFYFACKARSGEG